VESAPPYYNMKCDMVEDGLTEQTSEGNPGGGVVKGANPTLSCNWGSVGRNG
jgi:hypothetical protein